MAMPEMASVQKNERDGFHRNLQKYEIYVWRKRSWPGWPLTLTEKPHACVQTGAIAEIVAKENRESHIREIAETVSGRSCTQIFIRELRPPGAFWGRCSTHAGPRYFALTCSAMPAVL